VEGMFAFELSFPVSMFCDFVLFTLYVDDLVNLGGIVTGCRR
jgi:hypothetical protein